MKHNISIKEKVLKGEIQLSTSKSISNRLLIIKELCDKEIAIHNLSISDDTKIMENAFECQGHIIDAGHAGTSMRFLTAFFSQKKGDWILTGTDRMKKRPIASLVEGLRQLGAKIEYMEKEGFPPLKITGKALTGDYVKIDGSISSQFITAILLIAPKLPKGLTVELYNKIASAPYLKLTLELMSYFGIQYKWKDNIITIEKGDYKGRDITVEADWSGASYWYEMAAFADMVDLKIFGLNKKSLQGDSVVSNIFKQLGVNTIFIKNGVQLSKSKDSVEYFDFDFSDFPDLVQTVVVTCVFNNIPFTISGAESLKIKETDRILALQQELSKYNAQIKEIEHGVLVWEGINSPEDDEVKEIETYDDHRMAMAFAPIALKKGSVIIIDPGVVTKSYPGFWKDMESVGFTIDQAN